MTWKPVCRTVDVAPGEMREFDVQGVTVLIVNADGDFFAIPPECPHQEEPLRTGICEGKILTCTKHLWQWDLSTAQPTTLAEVPLKKYDLRMNNEQIEILIEKELVYDYSG